MAKTLIQIIGAVALTGVIQSPRGGIPDDILPPAFTQVARRVPGNVAKYLRVEGNRRTARIVHYGSPSQRRELKGVSEQTTVLGHAFEHEFHGADTLTALQTGEPIQQQLAEQVIGNQIRNFNDGFNNLRLLEIYSTLFNGKVWFDAKGNALPSATGAMVTVDFAVPAGNQGQLDVFGDTHPCIATSWDNAAADIPGQVKALRKAARKKTGYTLKYAFYGQNVLGYLLGNTAIKALIAANNAYQNAFLQNQIPDGFLGLTWIPVEEAFFEDDSGVNQDIAGVDQVIFTPSPSPDWWEPTEGSFPVPTTIGKLDGDTLAAANAFRQTFGKFSYAMIEGDPPSIKHLAGDTFLAILKVPGAIFQATVKF
jgi:hypothetical protein